MTVCPSRIILLLWALIIGLASASSVEKTFHLFQLLGNGTKPAPRGKITIAASENSGLAASFHHEGSAELDVAAFDRMVQNGGLYTLIVSDNPSLETSQYKVSASVPGCSVRRSNLREEITLSISPVGNLMSVSYRPLISSLAAKNCDNLMPLVEKPDVIFGRNKDEGGMPFKTTVAFESHKPMMEIPTILPQTRPPPGLNWYRKNAKNNPTVFSEGGGPPPMGEEEPQGFQSTFLYKVLTKYWYIILPLAIMSLLPVEDMEGAQGGGGAATAGATGTAAGGVAKQRRGKRD